MDQHARHYADLAEAACGQAQHLSAVRLHRVIVERPLVGTRAYAQRPTEQALDAALQHRNLHLVIPPLPERRIGSAMLLDQVTGNQRMTAETPRERRDAHSVVDAKL